MIYHQEKFTNRDLGRGWKLRIWEAGSEDGKLRSRGPWGGFMCWFGNFSDGCSEGRQFDAVFLVFQALMGHRTSAFETLIRHARWRLIQEDKSVSFAIET